jgi:hypothetical protein
MWNLVFWVFVLVLGLSFFGISVKAIVESPAGQSNFAYLLYLLSQIWYWALAHIQILIQRYL